MKLRDRVLVDCHGGDGPVLVAIGALHGNEAAGVRAIERVAAALRQRSMKLRGRFVGIIGNRRALTIGCRFVDRDLNRNWSNAGLTRLRAEAEVPAEDVEQLELLDVLGPLLDGALRPITFLDLHSSSGTGRPFVCASDVLRNRKVAFALELPVVLGLEEVIEGSLLGWLTDHGHVGICVEGGQHGMASTIANHEAALWITLVTAGLLEREAVPELARHCERLQEERGKTPRVLEVVHRQVLQRDDGFKMNAGWRSFDRVTRTQVVARDHHGPIRSPASGVMLLPLYQGQGDDGFFVARPVRRFWLRASTVARKLRLDRTLPWLPGVQPDLHEPDAVVARGMAARWLAPNVFHLFGFRRIRPASHGQVFMRRQPDEVGLRAAPAAVDPKRQWWFRSGEGV